MHPALARRIGRRALEILAGERFVGYDHVEALLELAAQARGSVSLPGQEAERQGDTLTLSRERAEPFANSFLVSLSIPGEVFLEPQGWAVSAHGGLAQVGVAGRPLHSRLGVAVLTSALTLPLAVRSRKRGDRFSPLGMGGQEKKLQDFLVDRKIPRRRRDLLPLVVDSTDRIVWVVGESVAEDFRVTEPSQGVIFLQARRLGGQG